MMPIREFVAEPFRRPTEPLPASMILGVFAPLIALPVIAVVWVVQLLILASYFAKSDLNITRLSFVVSALLTLALVEFCCWFRFQKIRYRLYGESMKPKPAKMSLTDSSITLSRRLFYRLGPTLTAQWKNAIVSGRASGPLIFVNTLEDQPGDESTSINFAEVSAATVFSDGASNTETRLLLFTTEGSLMIDLYFMPQTKRELIAALHALIPVFHAAIVFDHIAGTKIEFKGTRPDPAVFGRS